MSTSVPGETNNNDISSFEMADSPPAGRSPANAVWAKLTPQVLKVTIIILATSIVVCTTVTIAIVVKHMAFSGEELPLSPTATTPATSTTTTPTVTTSSTLTTSSTTGNTTTSSSTMNTTSSAVDTTSSSTMNTTSSTTEMTTSSSAMMTTSTSTSTSTATSTTAMTNATSSSTKSTATTSTQTSSTTVPECAQTQFLCGSGECIPWRRLCDGLPHCQDGSDEGFGCVCSVDQWKCSSGQCVSAEARCNQEVDCLDSSDEMQCPDCSGFQCDTGLCLWDGNHRRCNGVFDCPDLSDEMGCSGRAGTRQCNNTVRVLQSQWCDGLDDCGDNSDESDCTAVCRGRRTACSDGHCIMKTWRCDGYPDCQDGSDEVGCGTCDSTQFVCDNYQCVTESAVCDGVWDCKTGEDELHCFSAEEENSGVLWARYQGKDYAVCADEWTTDFAVQICIDIDQLQLLNWKEVEPSPSVTHFVAFNNNTLSAQTTNLSPRTRCKTGKVIHITCHKEECGNRKVAFLQSLVAGGQIVSPGKWPWMVSLLHLGKFLCGGTLVQPQWVVTAAHCILSATTGDFNFTSTPYYFDVLLGSTHYLGQSRQGTPSRIRVKRVTLYPNLTRPLYGGVDWDVALLELSVPVRYTDYIQPACLPYQGQSVPLTATCYLAGWGFMNPQQVLPTERLRDTRMQLWSEARCARNTIPGESRVNTNSTLCGGFIFGKPSTCQGDSGGPLICLAANRRWTLVGVMSRGSAPCGRYIPNIRANRFARVASMVDWIRQTMQT